ncbi:MAG: MFS transporter [Alcanivorax sp.]|nr:MFS transporter [Alcanivorax sp.]
MRFLDRRPPFFLMVSTGAACIVVLLVFARLSYGLVLPAMREGLQLSYGQAANLSTANALGYLLLVMVAGVFAARFGGKTSVLLGLVLVIAGFLGLSQTTRYGMALVLMVLLGMGTAFGYTPLISLLANTYPHRRGAVIGFVNSGVGIGMLLIGALAPPLTEAGGDGWRQVWLLFAGGGVLVTVLVALFLRNPPRPLAADTAAALGEPDAPIFRNPHVVIVGLVYGVLGLTFIVQSTFMYSYALAADTPARTAGHLVSAMGMLSVFAGPAWGWLSDRLGYANGLMLSMGLSLLATLIPVLHPVTWAFGAHFLLMGLCAAGMFSTVLAASTETVPAHRAPVAVSFVTLFYAVGQLLGPALAGPLIEWRDGFRLVFALSCVAMVIGVLLSAYSRRHQRAPSPQPSAD